MCPRELMVTPYGVMTDGLFRQIIDECVELKIPTIVLCGFGELFLDRNVKDKLAYAQKKNPAQKLTLTTNGSLIDEPMAEFLSDASWINIIRVSVSGFRAPTYRSIMKLDRDKIYANVVRLHRALKKKNSPTQLRVNGIYIEEHYQEKELDEYLAFWQENCDILEVWKPHNWTSAYAYRKSSVSEPESCGRPDNGPVEIMWNGNYKLCCFDFDGREIIGRYPETPLRKFWDLARLREIQDAHRRKEFKEVSTCAECDQVYSDKKEVLVFSNAGISSEERVLMTADFNKIDPEAVRL